MATKKAPITKAQQTKLLKQIDQIAAVEKAVAADPRIVAAGEKLNGIWGVLCMQFNPKHPATTPGQFARIHDLLSKYQIAYGYLDGVAAPVFEKPKRTAKTS